MEKIREQLSKPLVIGALGFLFGFVIGLFAFGWGLTPVKYYDAAPVNLHTDYQALMLRTAIDSYSVNRDPIQAKQVWDSLAEAAPNALAAVKINPGTLSPDAIAAFEAATATGAAQVPGETAVAPTEEPAKKGSSLLTLVLVLCVVSLLLGLAVVLFFVLRGKSGVPGELTAAQMANQAAREAEPTDYASLGEEAPMAQFMSSYQLGDDLFDESFSIDSPAGEFLGECGVSISETIGVGEPKKPTAMEVWVFDKNDIQTVTKVIMSDHAYADPTIRQRLEAKGEPFLVEKDGQTVLETATLRLVVRIVDIAYGEGALPEGSFFEKLTLELAIWQK